jgi:hypothetical protein
MLLDDVILTVQRDLTAALPADAPAAADAERLAAVLDSSLRLAVLRALAMAAEEITDDLPAGRVVLNLAADGTPTLRPEGVLPTPPHTTGADGADGPDGAVADSRAPGSSATNPAPDAANTDGDTARITLRLPPSVKAGAEEAAERAGVSTNRWLTQAVVAALQPAPAPRAPRPWSNRVTGWMN